MNLVIKIMSELSYSNDDCELVNVNDFYTSWYKYLLITCISLFFQDGCLHLSDEEILSLVKTKHIPAYKLETAIGNPERGVTKKRSSFQNQYHAQRPLTCMPY